MVSGRPPTLAGMTVEEKAVWARAYNSAYKRAWNARANAEKLQRRRALRGEAVDASSSSSWAPKEVATCAARDELSRFRAARDPPPPTPAADSGSTTPAAPLHPLNPTASGPLVFGSEPHSDSPRSAPEFPPSTLCFEEEPELQQFAAVCGAGALKLRQALALCGPVACPHAILVRSVDGALAAARSVDVMRAGTWALGGPVDVVHKALSRGGAGFWVFGGALGAQRAALALGEAMEVVQSTMEVIFNTTPAAEAKERGAGGDNGLRQLALDAGSLARLGLVPGLQAGLAAMDGMCFLLAHLFCIPYFSYSPVLLFSEPSAEQQLAHTDAAPVSLVGNGAPRVLGGLLAVQDNTQLRTWPGVQLTPAVGAGGTGAGETVDKARGRGKRTGRRAKTFEPVVENEATCAATEEDCFVLHVPVGCCVVFRGDAVHAGAGNPSSEPHWRMHVYFLSEGFTEFDMLKDTTLISW